KAVSFIFHRFDREGLAGSLRRAVQMSQPERTRFVEVTFISRIFCCLRGAPLGISVALGLCSNPRRSLFMRSYSLRWLAAVALVLSTATVTRASTLGLDVTSDTQVFAPGVFHNIGWQFSVNAPIIIDGLGLFDVNPPGLAESHQVGLWDNNGVLLAQT